MKKITFSKTIAKYITSASIIMVVVSSLFLFSFTLNQVNEKFLTELGISKTEANKKITESMLGGYLNQRGITNAKNIATANHSTVTKDLLAYVKQYVNNEEFKKEYALLKETNKPIENKIKTPDEMRNETIDSYKKSVESMEGLVAKADANSKALYQNMLADTKKQLIEAEDPNNVMFVEYANNYPMLLKSFQESYTQQLDIWETDYPTNHQLFVKKRLQQFLDETNDIDFTAALTTNGNKKIFVNPTYEGKSVRWKMAFRAGKNVIEPAREFVKQWIGEIK